MSFLYSGSLWSSLYCGVSSLCVGLYRWLVKVSWLGKLVSVFWWVELYFFSLLSKSWVAFLGAWCPLPAFRSFFVEFTRRLNALLMNLWGESVLPVLLLRHLGSSLLFLINVLTCSLSTSIGLPNHGASSSEKYQAQNFTNHFWHVPSVTALPTT